VHSDGEVKAILADSASFQHKWAKSSLTERSAGLRSLADVLELKKNALAVQMAVEMGKPVGQGRAEVEKSAWCCRWYSDELNMLLAPRIIQTEAKYSAVHYESRGVWLAIMPWNYPVWQVMRCFVPCIAAGNSLVLKHASNVTGCALLLEELVREALGDDALRVLKLSADRMADVISDPVISGVSFTGSESAGRRVAAMAAAHIRPAILELGGSNAFIVMPDADLEKAAKDAVTARFQNSGQSCIAAKRILLASEIADSFMELFRREVRSLTVGDPMLESTQLGPLARASFCEDLNDQVQRSIAGGAECDTGGEFTGAFFTPTILTGATCRMPCMQEELFGPVASVGVFTSWKEAVNWSNSTRFGLGVSVYTADTEKATSQLPSFREGAVFINSIVKSDPRLPFGGVGHSGFGRELSAEGLYSVMNAKTVSVST
jgi:succinate-semialdehyde dehydrogenase/glutarate-semialdehyde dehydrogenase